MSVPDPHVPQRADELDEHAAARLGSYLAAAHAPTLCAATTPTGRTSRPGAYASAGPRCRSPQRRSRSTWSTSPTANPSSTSPNHRAPSRQSSGAWPGSGSFTREAGYPSPADHEGVRRTLRGIRRASSRAGAALGKARDRSAPKRFGSWSVTYPPPCGRPPRPRRGPTRLRPRPAFQRPRGPRRRRPCRRPAQPAGTAAARQERPGRRRHHVGAGPRPARQHLPGSRPGWLPPDTPTARCCAPSTAAAPWGRDGWPPARRTGCCAAPARAGLDLTGLSPHSLRRGHITTAQAGAPERQIARTGRHASLVVLRGYIDDAEVFNDPSGSYLGL